MPLYIYTDETEFYSDFGKPTIGSGALFTLQPIEQDVVHEALANLKNDPDCYSTDCAITREYFHSSEDSPNAHSHLCRAIVKNINGNFHHVYFNAHNEKHFIKRTQEQIYRLTQSLSTLEIFNTENDEVILTIESRREFSNQQVEKWIEQTYHHLERMAYDSPTLITYFPKIKILSATKHEPGLQVVDFILWSMNRSQRKKPDDTWKNRLNLKLLMSTYDEHHIQLSEIHTINVPIEITKVKNYPFTVPNIDAPEDIYHSYLIMEHMIRHIYYSGLPASISHLENKMERVMNKLLNENLFFSNAVMEVASFFIRSFDTLPLYNNISNDDKNKWTALLKAKRVAGLFLRNDKMNGLRSIDAIHRWRHKIFYEQPHLLEPTYE